MADVGNSIVRGDINITGDAVIQGSGSTIGGEANLENAYLLIGTTSDGIGIDNNEIYSQGSLYFGSTGDVRFRSGGENQAILHNNGKMEFYNNIVIRGEFEPDGTCRHNMINLAVGTNSDGATNGISFHESSNGFGFAIGYNGVLAGNDNELNIYSLDSGDPPNDTKLWSFHHGGQMTGGVSYYDYAEYFDKGDSDLEPEPSDVIVVGEDDRYIKSTKAYDKTVVGVYSDEWGQIIGGEGKPKEELISVGLAGRLHVKVIGKVKPGDLLVSSPTPGAAMASRAYEPGTVIGKALEHKDTEEIGKVRMLIMNM